MSRISSTPRSTEKPGLIEGWRDRDQMRAEPHDAAKPVRAADCGRADLEHVTLLQGTKAYGAHLGPIPIPARERAPRHRHENFYWLQEDYLRAKQAGNRWHWTILRPQIVMGEAIGGNLNLIPAIGVYAALRREAGLPLPFPGALESVFEMVDTDLLARVDGMGGRNARPRATKFSTLPMATSHRGKICGRRSPTRWE